MEVAFWRISEEVQPLLGRPTSPSHEDDQLQAVEDDRLWEAQPALIEASGRRCSRGRPGKANVYAMAVAGSGTQALFARAAHEAVRVAALHFGDDSRGGALLSNGAADLLQSPLATRANIAAVAQAVGQKTDRRRDLLFLYLASHGGRTAELRGDRSVQPISAATTAEALRRAGVHRG